MGTASESSTWLTVILGGLVPYGEFLAKGTTRTLCVVGIAILVGCHAAPQPESRQPPAAGTTVQTVKSSQSNITPDVDDCGLTAYPASRSTQEILTAVPQPAVRPQNSMMFAKVAIDPEGRVTHLRVLRLAYPEVSKALRDTINAQAIDSIKRSRYTPTIIAGKPVAVCSDLGVTIDLH